MKSEYEEISNQIVKQEYYDRCIKYIEDNWEKFNSLKEESYYEYVDDFTKEHEEDTYEYIVTKAHKMHDYILACDTTFPGCHDKRGFSYCDFGNENDNEECDNCHWIITEKRCSCGNYKGFSYKTDNVNWLKDITLDDDHCVGEQVCDW